MLLYNYLELLFNPSDRLYLSYPVLQFFTPMLHLVAQVATRPLFAVLRPSDAVFYHVCLGDFADGICACEKSWPCIGSADRVSLPSLVLKWGANRKEY